MAEFIFNNLSREHGLNAHADSCATSTEEIGNDIHPGTRRMLRTHGVPFFPRAARQLRRTDYDTYDAIIAMDEANIRNILRITGGDPHRKIHKLLSIAGESRDVADPWYTGDFETTYSDITRGCDALIAFFEKTDKV